jgi:hypothetical protein
MSAISTTSVANSLGYSTIWTETFDTGLGRLGHTWGHVSVHDGIASVSSWAGEGWQPSGMMQFPGGASSGQGFGLYSVTMSIDSYAPGAFACLWPASDKWPGPELDLIELDFNGNAYSTVHWKGSNGGDAYRSYALSGVDARQVHTYSFEWQSDHMSMYVDGRLMWTTTEHVPQDYAHGGENSAFGVGEQPGWAAGYQDGNNTVHVYEMSYAAGSGGGGTSAPDPAPAPEPAPEPAPPPASDAAPAPAPAPVTDILKLTSGVDFVAALPGLSVDGFLAGTDKLVLPEGVSAAALKVTADHDWGHGGDAWGQRVSWDGGDVFLRYSWNFSATRDTQGSSTISPPATAEPAPAPAPEPAPPPTPAPALVGDILKLTNGVDFVAAEDGLSVSGFQTGVDKLVLPDDVSAASVKVFADHDWEHGGDAWGQRVAWDDGDVFLRYSWNFDVARDLVLG